MFFMNSYLISTKEFKLLLEKTDTDKGIVKLEMNTSGGEATFKFKEFEMAHELYKYLLKGFYENSSN